MILLDSKKGSSTIRTYLIAEVGINHNGSLHTCFELIKAAKAAGCNMVKFQKRNPDKCVPQDQKFKMKSWHGKHMTYLNYKKSIEFGLSEYKKINQFCKAIGIEWTASVWDVDSLEFMYKNFRKDVPFIKLPSACITDKELIEALNKTDFPVLFSGGMSTEEEIAYAFSHIKNIYGYMHCNSSYPSPYDEIDLNALKQYMEVPLVAIDYPIKFGYSGHEVGFIPTLGAVAIGAQIIERHITLDKEMEGSDHKASLEPDELKTMVKAIRIMEKALGKYHKRVYPAENVVKAKLRRKNK